MKIALAQINTTIGDIQGNKNKIIENYYRGLENNADVVVFPELALTGYPPRDLLLKTGFIEQNLAALNEIAQVTTKCAIIIGFADRSRTRPGRDAANSVALLQNGSIREIRNKSLLPSYDVFDEDRYFEPADQNSPCVLDNETIGLTICEDVWNDEDFWPERRYHFNPVTALSNAGARILFNISASPWHLGKNRVRHSMLSDLAAKTGMPIAYCNLVGGNDELIFDGSSLVLDANGEVIAQAASFEEDFVVVDTATAQPIQKTHSADEEKLYKALTLGTSDYLSKCGFKSALLGLSGGIDSALVATLAVGALGPENVHGVSLPSEFSSSGSLTDARALAENLGIRYDVLPIKAAFKTITNELHPLFKGLPENIAEENIQARLRGLLLMALSNKFGCLLLATGNKSELAVGYCTLYGDMCGGLSVISDLPKTTVYKLARWINRNGEIIPNRTIEKPPSAELKPGQTDQDSLPPYSTLDTILDDYIVNGKAPGQIAARGIDEAIVRHIIHLVNRSEYKRRQAAPGLKVTSKAFGIGRRIPIAQRGQ